MSIAVLIRESSQQGSKLHLVSKPGNIAFIGRFKAVDTALLVASVAEMSVEAAGDALHADVLAMLKNPPAEWEL